MHSRPREEIVGKTELSPGQPSPSAHRDGITRRAFVVASAEKLVFPLAVGGFGAWIGVKLTQRYQERHGLSIAVIPSGRAAPPQTNDPLMDNLLLSEVSTPVPEPHPKFVYTVVVRNSGDYTEAEVNVEIAFQGDRTGPTAPLSAELITSSSLLKQTIRAISPIEAKPSFAFAIPRLNPSEWLSLRTVWAVAVDLDVQVRSTAVSRSYHA